MVESTRATRFWRFLGIAGLLMALSFPLTACGAREAQTDAGKKIDAPASSALESPVATFFDAETKHGTLTFVSGQELTDPAEKGERVEYWFDGDRYRLTWFGKEGDSPRLHMISPDGKTLYYARVEDEITEIAYVLPEKHQWVFNGPPEWTPGEGEKVAALTAYTYAPKKLWSIPGSDQSFYLEDLVVHSDGKRIMKTVTRTSSKKVAEDDLVTSEYRFDEPELNVDIPEDVFELPYPVKKP